MNVLTDRPFSQACENNRGPILEKLVDAFAGLPSVLEVGSGTGQHATAFAAGMPWLNWQASDIRANHPGIRAWLEWAGLPNTAQPLEVEVGGLGWPPQPPVPAIFTANTFHIMPWELVVEFFAGLGTGLREGGVLCVYGPFNYAGRYTSESNARFDQWLAEVPGRGIRDVEAVVALAGAQGLHLVADHAMPANNRLLHWIKSRRGVGAPDVSTSG